MCGLVVLYDKEGGQSSRSSAVGEKAASMLGKVAHRGPDDQGVSRIGAAVLGHRRLSIIDLETGSQPMFNEDGTIAVILNGEIYNFAELRRDLKSKGHRFRSLSDTEVIVHLYEEVGEEVFSKLNGMFAAVVYDAKADLLLAGRDRMGEKPLVYWDSGTALVLASEIKAILEDASFKREIDVEALALYLNCMYVPAPATIFRGLRKVPPGHYLKASGGTIAVRAFWTPEVSIEWDSSEKAILEEFHELLTDAVRLRMVADVPLGVFLSGGIDSSAVTAFMARSSDQPIQTFSVGFSDEIDERPYARLVADRYQTRHTELLVEDRIEEVFQHVIEHFDEPFGDSSAIPTYLVAREARKYVKVVLTGDGGDELFAGYPSYVDQKYQRDSRAATRAYRNAGRVATALGSPLMDAFYPRSVGERALEHWLWVRTIFEERKIAPMLGPPAGSVKEFFRDHRWLRFAGRDPLSIAFEHDFNYYLPDDLLKKVDMAAMMSGLECRAPFLDHRIVEFSMRVPPHLKLRNDRTKYIMKSALAGVLPEDILRRPKVGFGAPVESWLRNQLREVTRDLLAKGCMIDSLLPRDAVEATLQEFYARPKTSDFRVASRLWLLLVLEIWSRRYA